MTTDRLEALRRGIRSVLPRPARAIYFQCLRAYQRYQLTRGRRHEPNVCRVLRLLIEPGWTCVDVGANSGVMTVLMAKLVGPKGRVFAFEPHPDNGVRIQNNLRLCRLEDRVECKQAAVNDGGHRSVKLYAGRRRSHCEWNTIGVDADGRTAEAVMTVDAVCLDDAIPSQQRVDLVKIDVEGAESQVLAGMGDLLRRWSPVLVIECHSESNWTACTGLCDQGYRLFDMDKRPLDPEGPLASAHILAIKTAQSRSLAA